jgi:hypothetical protein
MPETIDLTSPSPTRPVRRPRIAPSLPSGWPTPPLTIGATEPRTQSAPARLGTADADADLALALALQEEEDRQVCGYCAFVHAVRCCRPQGAPPYRAQAAELDEALVRRLARQYDEDMEAEAEREAADGDVPEPDRRRHRSNRTAMRRGRRHPYARARGARRGAEGVNRDQAAMRCDPCPCCAALIVMP